MKKLTARQIEALLDAARAVPQTESLQSAIRKLQEALPWRRLHEKKRRPELKEESV